MVPQIQVTTGQWNTSNTVTGGYMASHMRNTVLPGVITNLQNVLGSHIVNRNVLLSSSVGVGYYPDRYTWTTAYATLMSFGQITGTFSSIKYNDGEANYKLPVFRLIDYKTGYKFWTRCLSADNILGIITYNGDGALNYDSPNATCGVRPLIYLR